MTLLTRRFDDALLYASHIHGGHLRKGTSIPYLSHLLSVSALTMEHGGDEDQAIGALLHDAAEDCGGEPRLRDIRLRFGEAVADIVSDCTDSWTEPKPPWRARKEAYLASIAHKPEASLLVSLADKTHNARAIAADLRESGDALWSRFSASPDETLWYYRSLAEAFGSRMPCALAGHLERSVMEMHQLAGKA